jgi:NAD(P)-dependent dehydrogenase (short-subunit alcohol dehydrogenase family)
MRLAQVLKLPSMSRVTLVHVAQPECEVRAGVRSRALAAEIGARGRRALVLPTDMRDVAAVRRMVAQTEAAYGRIDVLINNAGIVQSWAQPEDVPLAEWDLVFDTDLKSAFVASQAAGAGMLARGSGAIVNIGSIAGVIGLALTTAYSAAKAGMIGMTKAMAVDWAPRGVRVNLIAPAFIATPANQALRDDDAARRAVEAQTPMGRFGTVDEIAAAAVFLASRAAAYITGEVLLVDGGWTAQ